MLVAVFIVRVGKQDSLLLLLLPPLLLLLTVGRLQWLIRDATNDCVEAERLCKVERLHL